MGNVTVRLGAYERRTAPRPEWFHCVWRIVTRCAQGSGADRSSTRTAPIRQRSQ